MKIANVSRLAQQPDINVEDMAEVSPINTNDLLNNIHNRYDKDLIFTNVGETLIVVNPYQIIPGLYTQDRMEEIIKASNEKTLLGFNKYVKGSPHVYDTTMNTIFDLINYKKDQALVISGESGAGKTECAKLCMKFIAFYFSSKAKGEDGSKEVSLEDKILACNPVLESFGNSKTVRNDNSSRFGKYIKIFANIKTKSIVGAFMETYLLEKSRVCSIAPGERNYHIFYQVILGLNLLVKEKFNYDNVFAKLSEMKLNLQENTKKYIRENLTESVVKDFLNITDLTEVKLENFGYLKNNVYTVEKINDVYNFYETIEGMVNTNFTPVEITYVIKITLAILFIGNIDFIEEPSKDKCHIGENGVKIQNKVCEMLNIDKEIFKNVFLFNVRIINGQTINSDLKLSDCIAYRDTFAKEIYNRLFTFLVKRMNLTLFDENIRSVIETDPNVKHIGLLDIFGFECFVENSFEQFCINYANEKLQNLYVEDIFKEIENMFKREGLAEHYNQIEFKDNQVILDAMGKKPLGIFFQLDNECNVGQKDMNLLSRILSTLKDNPSVKSSLKHKEKFFILHTAKDVEYNIMNFCMKNLDEFKLRMKDSINSIKDAKTIEMIGEEDEDTKGKKEKYLGGKFRVDMDNLAHALRQCVRHYIRCLKPNEEKRKNYFVNYFSLQQIKYMGILDTIKIRQEGFPIIKTHLEFYLRYEDAVDFKGKLFYSKVKEDNPNLKEWCEILVKNLMPDYSTKVILFGKTVILMKQKFFDDLDQARAKAIEVKEQSVTKIALKYRGKKTHKSFSDFYKAIFTLQQNFKLFEYINKMNKMKEIVKILQTKSKILTVKDNSKQYIEKIQRIKRMVVSAFLRRKSKQAYIKALQTKYVITNYVKSFKHQKYLKYRNIVKNILVARIEKHIKNSYVPIVIQLQKNYRGYISRKHMGELYDNIVKRRSILKEEIQCKKIQKHFRKHFYMNKILLKQKAVDKFIALCQYKKFHSWYTKTRENAITIQRAYKRRYLMRHIIQSRLKEFTEMEDNLFEEANYVSAITLFPNHQISTNNERGSQATLMKMNKLQKFYDKKLKNLNPTKLFQNSYLNHSPYDEPKLHFFAHILDLDCLVNLDDIYSTPWSETFQEVMKHNIKQNTPIQLIEVGEMHTTLVNSSGKTFTWGWNGNGQCAFNIGKDKDYLYEDFKVIKRNTNNMVRQDIRDAPAVVEGGLDDNFDFDAEINNIKEEEELFDNHDGYPEGFSESDFENFYYLSNPMIIDNFNLRKIKCGDDYTMVLTKENKMYVFGANYDYQLGVLKNRNIFSPMSLYNIVKTQQENPNVNLKSNIIDMKTSGKNCVLLNEAGNMILLSCNTSSNIRNKTPIEIPVPNAKFSNIECGKDFCLLLTQNGYVYSFGDNKYGQLGQGDFEDRTYPTMINYFVDKKIKVTQISCGYKHCCAKGNNKAYSWGCNTSGQLGTSNFKNMAKPFFNDIKFSKITNNILQVSCGFRATVFLTETRQVFWCGTCGDISQQDVPIEFNYASKVPELFSYDNHHIIKINHSWCRTMSVLYATVAETAPLKFKMNNPNKLKFLLNTLTNKWTTKDLYPPKVEQMENYIAGKHIVKVPKATTTTKRK